MQNFFFILHVA